jgi:hypothetical protein
MTRKKGTRTARLGALLAAAVMAGLAVTGLAVTGLATAGPAHADTSTSPSLPPVLPRQMAADPGTGVVVSGSLTLGDEPAGTQVYTVYWGWALPPSGSDLSPTDTDGEGPYLDNFLSSLYAASTQEVTAGTTTWLQPIINDGADGEGLTSGGGWYDDTSLSGTVSEASIEGEVASAFSYFTEQNELVDVPDSQIIIALPPDVDPTWFPADCAEHGDVTEAGQSLSYVVLPYLADVTQCGADSVNGSSGALDGVSIVAGDELADAITDPTGSGAFDASGYEAGDKCAWTGLSDVTMSDGTFAVPSLWNNSVGACTIGSTPVYPSTVTERDAGYSGDYCELSNVTNKGVGWRINSNGTMSGLYLNEGASFPLGAQVSCWFANGMYETLVLQGTDGNLVFYQHYTPKTWAAGTNGKSAYDANFQGDGNFVVYNSSGTALWASNTHTYPDAVLVLQADGNLVIYSSLSSGSAALWSTGTYVAALD